MKLHKLDFYKFNLTVIKFYGFVIFRIIKQFFGNRLPIFGTIKITRRCNFRCAHCTWWKDETNDLSTEKWKEIIEKLYIMGCRILIIEGGEPTLRKDLEEIIQYAKRKGYYFIALYTNGSHSIDELSADIFVFSIDGVGETHDRIREKHSFNRLIGNINKLYINRVIFSITIISKLNMNELDKICEYFHNKIDGLGFSLIYPFNDLGNLSLNYNEKRIVSQKLAILKKKYPNIINSYNYIKSLGNGGTCDLSLYRYVDA
ncbi:MAG: radical SAM protein, partial [Candidatus Saganbacteria bacterium]|nr:radical SAM protein [Candidatus Saganbacteria bacterium]